VFRFYVPSNTFAIVAKNEMANFLESDPQTGWNGEI